MEKTNLTLGQIDAFVIAYNLSNYVWELVMKWENFTKWSTGKQ
ncbi:MAG: hypothetical protein R2830_12245 [Saprospiraceae bacterium]